MKTTKKMTSAERYEKEQEEYENSFEGFYGDIFYALQGTIHSDDSVHRLQLLQEWLEMFDNHVKTKINKMADPKYKPSEEDYYINC